MVLDTLIAELKSSGLAERPGKLLYSGLNTLKPGDVYLLGYNPGGDPEVEAGSILSHLISADVQRNEYIDAQWRPGGRLHRRGEAPMQKRICCMLTALGLDVRSVCASNVIFVRSRGIAALRSPEELANTCWPVHRQVLKIVQPKHIITLGDDAFEYICGAGSSAGALCAEARAFRADRKRSSIRCGAAAASELPQIPIRRNRDPCSMPPSAARTG